MDVYYLLCKAGGNIYVDQKSNCCLCQNKQVQIFTDPTNKTKQRVGKGMLRFQKHTLCSNLWSTQGCPNPGLGLDAACSKLTWGPWQASSIQPLCKPCNPLEMREALLPSLPPPPQRILWSLGKLHASPLLSAFLPQVSAFYAVEQEIFPSYTTVFSGACSVSNLLWWVLKVEFG